MSAPGLTCTTCESGIYPDLARRTNDGWKHVSQIKCANVRSEQARRERNAAIREDVLWMVETGESLAGAADRLGMNARTLDSWLRRHGLRDALGILTSRDPIGIDTRASRRSAA